MQIYSFLNEYYKCLIDIYYLYYKFNLYFSVKQNGFSSKLMKLPKQLRSLIVGALKT